MHWMKKEKQAKAQEKKTKAQVEYEDYWADLALSEALFAKQEPAPGPHCKTSHNDQTEA